MGKLLGGVSFIYNGVNQDYNFIETIKSMLEYCDQVYVVDCGSTDGTVELMEEISTERFTIIKVDNKVWQSIKGPTKLSEMANLAMDYAEAKGMDYIHYVQADELLHESSYIHIRHAIEIGKDAFVGSRYNLFRDPYSMLNVEQSRKPVSTEVVRLARSSCRTFSDGESLIVPSVSIYQDLDALALWHFGFVRSREKHVAKMRHMQEEVFQMTLDERARDMTIFDWSKFYNEEDLIPIHKPLPKIMQSWAAERYPELQSKS